MNQSEDNRAIPMTSISSGSGIEVRDDVYYYTNQIVNLIFLGKPGGGDWVLIDAGMPKSGEEIIEVAEKRFGNSPPAAIVLTHGHFDHIGSIVQLLAKWNVPVYAHPDEFPFLIGEASYPEPDTTVEGGLLAKISSMYPVGPINIQQSLLALPEDFSVPFLPGWRWIHTPGHSPGHVSFFRDTDGTMISGDAFITVRQDSLYKVLVQEREVHGPPRYLTTQWSLAWDSVRRLELLVPELVVAGHGQSMDGHKLRDGLRNLVEKFDELAIPRHGKFVEDDLSGTSTQT